MRCPPKKRAGQGRGHRKTTGALLDVRTGTAFLGGTEKQTRGLVARRLIPFRRLGARIYFVRAELEQWIQELSGCSLDEATENLRAREGGR